MAQRRPGDLAGSSLLVSKELTYDDPSENGPRKSEVQKVLYFLRRRQIALNVTGFAPSTQARQDMIDAGRTDLQKILAAAYESSDPPITPVFALPDVLAAVRDDVPPAECTLKAVHVAVHALGCRPIRLHATKQRQVRVDGKRVSLWARTAESAARLAHKSTSELAELYERHRKRNAEAEAMARAKAESTAAEDFLA